MSSPLSPEFNLDQSNADLDGTIVDTSAKMGLQQVNSESQSGGSPDEQQQPVAPNFTQMCQLMDNLQQQMARMHQDSRLQMLRMQRESQQQVLQMMRTSKYEAELAAQREAALVKRLDDMNLRFQTIDSRHDGGAAPAHSAFPYDNEASNIIGGPNSVASKEKFVDAGVSHHNNEQARQSHSSGSSTDMESGGTTHTHETMLPSTSSVHTHAASSLQTAPVRVPSHPHVSFLSTHAPASHPSSTQPTSYFARMPPSVPSYVRHQQEEWASAGSSSNAAQPHMLADYGHAAVIRRHEQRRLLDLPPFSGSPEDWPKLEHAFRNTTDAFGYDNVENLLRLQKCLSGEAERAVESLLIQPDHVPQVMETLFDTFGHPDLLIRSQIERVRRLPQVHEAHLEQLVPFANVVRNVATYLDSPTSQHHLANPILLDELATKLPVSRRVDWAAVASQIRPYATIKDFAIWICGVARIVRLAIPSSAVSKATTSQNSAAGRSAPKPQVTKRVLLNAANAVGGEKRFQCGFCDKEHETDRCFLFKNLSVTERWRIVMDSGWCYGCLGKDHILPSCKTKQQCAVNGCSQWHHELLHDEVLPSTKTVRVPDVRQSRGEAKRGHQRRRYRDADAPQRSKVSTQLRTSTNVADHCGIPRPTQGATSDVHQERVCTVQERTSRNTLLFRVMPITLHANGRQLQTFALFDEGSSVSLIDDSLVDEMEMDGPVADLSMKWFGKQTTVLRSRKLTIGISGRSTPDKQYAMNIRTIRNLSLPAQTVQPETLYASNPHLRDVPLESFRNAVPRVLIGLDNHHLGIPQEVKANADDDGLVAVRSKLGWTVYGSDGPAYLPNAMVLLVDGERDEDYDLLNEVVRNFITSEDFGVRTPLAAIESDDDIRARSILQRTTKRVGDRFETGLLWRRDDVSLPPSYDMALRRLVSIEARMRRDPVFAEQYANQINAYLSKGYARKLSTDELQSQDARTWYLPHFAVVNPNKPGRFRLVFDAAAKVRDTSLNTELLSGPDDNMPLTRLLFQFRLGEVGVCADIAEMFHQVRIREQDQGAQRFLWRGGDSSAPPDVYTMTVMTFGSTCSPSAAQYVKNINADEFQSEFPDAAEAIRRRHYVDDYVASFATPEEAARVSAGVVEVHRRGGFDLRGFVSNSHAVLEALGASTGPGELVDLEPESTFEKILGMIWNTADDTFRFRTKFSRVPQGVLDGIRRPTKRIILSTCMSVFDPYGLLANFMLPPKLLVQDMYRMGLDWDEPAPDEIRNRWEAWRVEIGRTHLLRVPRCPFYNVDTIDDLQLHVFSDASEAAFAAVAFWRITRGDQVELSFVAGKVKVTPTPIQSMPRLELNGAVLATRLLDEIRRSHEGVQIHKIVMWSDSETVLKWIRSDQRKYKQFVGFRVAEIAESTPTAWWRWVPTSKNVADDGTRVRNPPTFEPDGRWLWGPAWLCDKEETWPKQRDADKQVELCPDEVRSKYVGVATTLPFIDFTRFSSYHRLCRSVAWMLRFIHNVSCRRRKKQRTSGELSAGEVDDGLKVLCRTVQMDVYTREYEILRRGKSLDRTSSIFGLNPRLDDDGLMRLHGRTDAASDEHLAFDARRPILLPRHHHFSMLMVRSHHERMAHQLIDATIASVRRRFWVPQVRVLVRSVQHACQKCRIRSAAPVPPVQGQLPIDRMTPFVRPFASTGLDYFGPVVVKIGRRHEKRWIALFTCMTIRAVHLEIATNLSTDACLLCIRNLINVRGVPKLIRCDNGTNFIGARNQLRTEKSFFDPDAVQRELTTRGITWKFNRPGNPEAGGAWERLVQSVKRVLAVTLPQTTPEVETLRAHLIEAANILNSRPLTHIPVDPEEDEPITPNHFLVGGPNLTTAPDPADIQSLCSREQWVRCREMTRRFWALWVRDYLPELTRRSRHYPAREPPQPGDLVIVCDDGQPRSRWRRGRIMETSTGADGLIRSAKVRTTDGEYWRPTTKLAILDVNPPQMDSPDGARDVADR